MTSKKKAAKKAPKLSAAQRQARIDLLETQAVQLVSASYVRTLVQLAAVNGEPFKTELSAFQADFAPIQAELVGLQG